MTRSLGWLVLLGALVALVAPGSALALDPSRSVHQLKLTQWGVDQGAPANILDMSQSSDGFLWLAASSGLYRFDGVTFEHIPAIAGDRTRSTEVTTVLAARDGSVWVGHLWGGLSVFRNGVMHDANHGPPTGLVARIVEAPDGAIWVATDGFKGGQISRYKSGRWTDAGVSLGLPFGYLQDARFARDGTFWVLMETSVSKLSQHARRYLSEPSARGSSDLIEDRGGRMWSTGLNGIRAMSPDPDRTSRPADIVSKRPYGGCALFDRDGNLLACRADATLEIVRPWSRRASVPAPAGAAAETIDLSDDHTLSLFEDKEGDLWIGGANSLNEVKSTNIVWQPSQGVHGGPGPQIAMAADGRLYSARTDTLSKIGQDGTYTPVDRVGSISDPINMLCADRRGGLWVLLRSTLHHWAAGHVTPLAAPPDWNGNFIYSCAVDGGDNLWVAVVGKGLFRHRAGAWTHVEYDPTHPNGWPFLTADRQGRILAYSPLRSIFRLDRARVEQLGSIASTGVGFARTVHSRPADLLIGGDYGLSRYDGHRFTLLPSDRYPWLAATAGIVETPDGDTWLNGAQGIVRVRTVDLDRAFAQPDKPIPHELFGVSDGLKGSVLSVDNFEGGLAPGGAVLFQTNAGRVWIDPHHLHRNPTPPPVVIKAVTADHHSYPAGAGLVLPAGVRNLQIDYTALSLVAPQRVQFRYRLGGIDKDWVDPGSRRQAFYTNLNPGNYRFDVIAANNDGVWNKTGATLDFRIRPTFWQTPFFAALVVLVTLAMLWALYTLRLREMAQRIKLRLEDRLAERERIARELHDTLLQGFQGLTMRFQSVAEQIPPAEPARDLLEQALERADQVLVEGRDRVRNLRGETGRGELAYLIEAAAYRLRVDPDVVIDMFVEGDCRQVHPVVCDDLLAIASEALFNAFKHAQATRIDIGLACGRGGLRLRIADNGIGFDPSILKGAGRPGHYGLLGMYERAHKLKAELIIRNCDEGAEIQLLVPGHIAYVGPRRRWSPFPRSADLES